MKYQNNILEIADLSPDYMGFIFYSDSLRYVGADWAGAELSGYPIKKVGVFVDESIENMTRLAGFHGLDVIQLHGQENPEIASEMRNKGYKVWKSFAIAGKESLDATQKYVNSCEYFLFDTPGKLPGGNGYVFDWSILDYYQGPTPFWLSGGLDADLAAAISQNPHPYRIGLDFNSKLEIAPAHKDPQKTAQAIAAVWG